MFLRNLIKITRNRGGVNGFRTLPKPRRRLFNRLQHPGTALQRKIRLFFCAEFVARIVRNILENLRHSGEIHAFSKLPLPSAGRTWKHLILQFSHVVRPQMVGSNGQDNGRVTGVILIRWAPLDHVATTGQRYGLLAIRSQLEIGPQLVGINLGPLPEFGCDSGADPFLVDQNGRRDRRCLVIFGLHQRQRLSGGQIGRRLASNNRKSKT